ncbi:MAG: sugar ABC transporter permease [Candidatus Promineifilaceae bacterium]
MPALPAFWNQFWRKHLDYQRQLRLLLLPYALGIIILVVVPAGISFALAFFQYDALSPPRWVGTLNFILTYTDELFNLSLQNSLALILLPVPLRVLGAFLLANVMRRGGRFLGWLRAFVYLPTTIPMAAYALAWLWILNPLYGPVNLLLRLVGLDPPAWFADPLWAKPALILLSFWQIGEGFLVSLAALHDMPAEIEDAARIDGAGAGGIFRYITLPILSPILLLLAFRDAILTFESSFAAIFFTTGGGPYYATFTLPMFVYEQAFGLHAFGVASVALWVLYVLTGLIVLFLYLIARQWDIGTTEETFVI